MPKRFVTHSKKATTIAAEYGWLPGARYTNLRDIRGLSAVAFLDIDWKNYSFQAHFAAAARAKPLLTIARDVVNIDELKATLVEAEALLQHSDHVAIVPKDREFKGKINALIPEWCLVAYSVPSKYGHTSLSPNDFDRPVHLLGGRPDTQRQLAELMPVVSFDCNRFTLDAAYGDYFDGEAFRPHPTGGYENCLRDSIRNINDLWANYTPENFNWKETK